MVDYKYRKGVYEVTIPPGKTAKNGIVKTECFHSDGALKQAEALAEMACKQNRRTPNKKDYNQVFNRERLFNLDIESTFPIVDYDSHFMETGDIEDDVRGAIKEDEAIIKSILGTLKKDKDITISSLQNGTQENMTGITEISSGVTNAMAPQEGNIEVHDVDEDMD